VRVWNRSSEVSSIDSRCVRRCANICHTGEGTEVVVVNVWTQ